MRVFWEQIPSSSMNGDLINVKTKINQTYIPFIVFNILNKLNFTTLNDLTAQMIFTWIR